MTVSPRRAAIPPVTFPRPHVAVRVLLAAAAVLTASACATSTPGSAAAPTPEERAPERLLVVDAAASAVHVYSVPEHELVASIDGVAMSDHAGLLPLPGGRVLLADAEADSVLALDVSAPEPVVAAEATLPGEAVHLAVDPGRTTVAVSTSSSEGSAVSLFDIDSLDPVGTVTVSSTEPGLVLGDDFLVHRDGAQEGTLELVPIGGVSAGAAEAADVADTTAVGAWGHGEALVGDRVYVATDDGLQWAQVEGGAFGATGSAAWAAGDRAFGRAYFLRVVGADDPRLWTYVRDDSAADWGAWDNDVYVHDPATGRSERRQLGQGLAFRLATSADRAVFARMHPDGYAAHVFDADPASDTFLEELAEVPLETPTDAPGRDADPDAVWSSPGRPMAAVSADGATAYVSRGGDGLVDVVDVDGAKVAGTIETPTSLDKGGYLLVVGGDAPTVDTIGR